MASGCHQISPRGPELEVREGGPQLVGQAALQVGEARAIVAVLRQRLLRPMGRCGATLAHALGKGENVKVR